jgi:hypothetical protein
MTFATSTPKAANTQAGNGLLIHFVGSDNSMMFFTTTLKLV